MELEAVYGQAFTFAAPVISTIGAPRYWRGGSFSTGDVRVNKNGGAFSNINSLPTEIEDGEFAFSLTAAELQGARVTMRVVRDSHALFYDQTFLVRTVNTVGAAIPAVTASFGKIPDVNMIQWRGTVPLALASQRVLTQVGAAGVLEDLSQAQAESAADAALVTYDGLVPGDTPTNWGSMGIEADGHVHGDIKQWLGVAPLALVSQRVQTDVRAMINSIQNQIADHVFRRHWGNITDGDTEDDRSLMGMMAQQVNLVAFTGGDMKVFRSDDVTVFVTKALTITSGADHVVGINPP